MPNGDDMSACYPERAQQMNIEGRSTIRCTVTAKGSLTACAVTSESPADYGFGAATTGCLARLFKVRPMTVDGTPSEGGVFQKTIVWQLPKDE